MSGEVYLVELVELTGSSEMVTSEGEHSVLDYAAYALHVLMDERYDDVIGLGHKVRVTLYRVRRYEVPEELKRAGAEGEHRVALLRCEYDHDGLWRSVDADTTPDTDGSI